MNRQATLNRDRTLVAVRLTLIGRVQGIGLRPAVARWAGQLALTGRIGNTVNGVEIVVEGSAGAVDRFQTELCEHLPPAACVESMAREAIEPAGCAEFEIVRGERNGPLSARVPPDIAACEACLAETAALEGARSDYPMTSCTDCGPRYSIIETMPYERADTSMAAFPLCPRCLAEYESPNDRRFHAQTNACPQCGPQVWCCDASGRRVAERRDAIEAAAREIRSGRIVAVRGSGGYQLVADATSGPAIQRLRRRKARRGKPMAVMVASLDDAGRLARLDAVERQTLRSRAAPIVVVEARSPSPLAVEVGPGMNTVGLMLPTTPLHLLLLLRCGRPLVVTSGNREGEPLVYRREDALSRLREIADLWLEHDRPIVRPIDDSVVRVMAGRAVSIRLARGLAPLPLDLEATAPTLALGGHQKSAIALSNGRQSVLGPHIGDLDGVAACKRFSEQLSSLGQLYGVHASTLICDEHPDYFTSQWAARQSLTLERVQHHHAHVVAGMLEHGWLDRQVLGVAFDGTGYGADGTIWGGEFLLSTAAAFTRAAHLRPFRLAGGDRAVREPWRVAVALVAQAAGSETAARSTFDEEQAGRVLSILNSARFSPVTTSIGRLFDGVAALVLGVTHCEFEGQAAMLLEAACDPLETGSYPIELESCSPQQLDWRPLIAQLLRDRSNGETPGRMAMRFHRGLAHAVARLCRRFAPMPVVLGGGVFQNRVLVELLQAEFHQQRQPCGLPGVIPPNDGGLAAGQLAVVHSRRAHEGHSPCA